MLLPLLFSWSTNQKSERVELWAKSYRERESLLLLLLLLMFFEISTIKEYLRNPHLYYITTTDSFHLR